GHMLNVGRLRRVLSQGAGWFARVALGVDERTVSSFFRVYRAALLRSGIHRYGDSLIRESGFACKAELLGKLRALGARVEEVPVLGDKFRFRPTGVGFYDDGRLFSMNSLREFLTFPLLPFHDRLRLGAFVARCQMRSSYEDLDDVSLEHWLRRMCGRRAWE